MSRTTAWVTDADWLPDTARQHTSDTHAAAAAAFNSQTSAHWLAALSAAGVSSCSVQFRAQLLDDPQALANGCFVELEHDVIGAHTVVAPPLMFSETALRAEKASPPLGRDTAAILAEAGLAASDVERLARSGVIVIRD